MVDSFHMVSSDSRNAEETSHLRQTTTLLGGEVGVVNEYKMI